MLVFPQSQHAAELGCSHVGRGLPLIGETDGGEQRNGLSDFLNAGGQIPNPRSGVNSNFGPWNIGRGMGAVPFHRLRLSRKKDT